MNTSNNTIRSLKILNEPVMITKDGKQEPYVPKEIIGHRGAYAASLHLLFKHVADFHVLMIDILSEKYGIPADEMISACHEDERFQNMVVHPTITALQYFDEDDAAKHIPVVPTEAPTESPAETPQTKTIKIKKPRIKKAVAPVKSNENDA
jgi:hypothetical protein